MDTNIDNTVFMLMCKAPKKRQRVKGYYICISCGEFLKAIPKRIAHCPFCDRTSELILRIDSVQEHITTGIWKETGCYSDLRADKFNMEGVIT